LGRSSMNENLTSTSKFLSLILRHKPETIGLVLDENGWADVEELLSKAAESGRPITRTILERVVAENDKKRFAFDETGQRIRASQGHSIDIDLALTPVEPPSQLYHGTATRFVESIREKGLIAGNRQHVHLSADHETAIKVGQRHGKPIVLSVDSGAMVQAGHVFFRSANGVWLTDHVPPQFLTFSD
jgi:putative RNA 2'-phosphotransferase